MKSRNMTAVAIVTALLFAVSMPMSAQAKDTACTAKEKTAVRGLITKQINAIVGSDWKKAYSYSAASFQKAVPYTSFRDALANQYVFLIYNDGFGFGTCTTGKDGFTQIATFDYHGAIHTLAFVLSIENKRLGVLSANEIPTPSTKDALGQLGVNF